MGCRPQSKLGIILLLLVFAVVAKAQLVGSFRVTNFVGDSITNGCSPLVITLVDSSKFNGSAVPYVSIANGGAYNSHTWFFGNPPANNFSTQQRPGFVYANPGTYTVTLVVTANGVTYDTVTKQITVNPQPVVGFTASTLSGCGPLTVTFQDTSINSVSCTWSMGDGTVITGPCTVTHTFIPNPAASTNCFTVTLISTSPFGCQNSLTKSNYICITPRPEADFTADNIIVCDSPFTVNFTDASVALNPLTYFWRFEFPAGSPSSTLQNPTYTYPVSTSAYTVALIVTDNVCNTSDTVIKTNYISTSNVNVGFTVDTNQVCLGQALRFTSNITGTYTNVEWNFGNGITSSQLNPTYTYPAAGTYNVRLRVFAPNGCLHDTTYTNLVTIHPRPTPAFTYSPNPANSCQAPFNVQFTDQSVGATTWYWQFQHPSNLYNTNQQNPGYTYNQPGTYSVGLTVSNVFGCQASITYPNIITIAPTTVAFSVDSQGGCAPLSVNFTDASTSPANNPIIGWTWNFDDPSSGTNNTSSQRNPTHTYNAVGTYRPCLTIVTQAGCVGTRCIDVTVGNPPSASFIVSPLTVCVDEPINFINTSTGIITDYEWIFGAPSGQVNNDQNPQPFAFDEPGTYDIQLTVGQNGCEDDTTITITVEPPRADFDVSVNCSNPGTVIFTDRSQGADVYSWNFDNPGSPNNTSNLANPSHTYTASGIYTVTLTVTNLASGCTHEYEEEVEVSILNAAFTPASRTGCAPVSINFANNSTGAGLTHAWNFGDPLSGGSNTSNFRNSDHNFGRAGVYNVRLIVTDVYGCRDTATETVRISSVEARFNVNTRNGCIPSNNSSFPTFNFTDQSVYYQNDSISSWNWSFGTPPGSNLRNPSHQYSVAGIYDVSLTVTNTVGCVSTLTLPQHITVRQPIADFTTQFNVFCSGQAVNFVNQSTGLISGTTMNWNFGDPNTNADTSRQNNPSYVYSDTGSYTVTLTVIEGPLGCRDSVTKPAFVTIDVPDLRFVANDTFRYCPPHIVDFTNFANFDTVQVSRVRWDFGDGLGFSTLLNPSYIYNRAGLFTVCLWVEFANGCQDSICYPDYINIGGAVGNISAVPDTGCSPLNVCFDANTDSSAINHIWFFGDNSPWEQGEDTICHLYGSAGIYQPAVMLIDTQVPACQYVLTYDDSIVVDSVIARFGYDLDTVCQNAPVQFTDSSMTLSGNAIVRWEWDFDDTSPIDTTQNPVHGFLVPGLRTVTLNAYSSYGCVGTISHQIFVWDRPTADFDASDTIGCEQLLVTYTDQSSPGDAPISAWYWDFGVVDSTNDTSVVQNPPPYFYADTGHYVASLLVTDANGCADTVYQNVDVYPNPNGLANPDTVSVCLFDTLQLLGDSSYANYDWTPGIWLNDSTIARPWAVPLDTIDYELITTDQYGCFTVDSIHVIVNPLPTLTVSPYPDTAICEGQSVQLSAVGNGIGFLWSPPDGLDDPNSPTPLATPAQTTTYEIYTVDRNGCNTSDTVRIVVNRFFTNYIVERVCLGNRTDIVDLSTTSDLPITTWQWDFGDTNTTLDVSTVRSPNYTYPDSGNYVVTLVLTDVIGCTDTTQQIARVDHPAEPEAYADTIICFGDAIQLTAIGGDTIYWTPAIDIDDPNSFTPIVSPQVTTTYVANITYGVCPFDTARVTVQVNPTPLLDIDAVFDILRGDSVTLDVGTGLYDTIFWEPATALSCTDCPDPLAKPDSTITYTVTVIDSLGCTNTKQVTVRVEERCDEDQIFVGNGFTPNGDGINDKAYARLRGLKGLVTFRVFDRWGDLVFETNNAFEGWDGKNSKGEQLISGVYVYIVEAECFSGRKITKTGNVAIIK